MIKFELKKVNGTHWGIKGSNLPKWVCHIVSDAIDSNHTSDEAYILRTNCGAFLQGYNPDSGWVLVEFWVSASRTDLCQPFVDYINRKIEVVTHYCAVCGHPAWSGLTDECEWCQQGEGKMVEVSCDDEEEVSGIRTWREDFHSDG
jgi:hypothetical protein